MSTSDAARRRREERDSRVAVALLPDERPGQSTACPAGRLDDDDRTRRKHRPAAAGQFGLDLPGTARTARPQARDYTARRAGASALQRAADVVGGDPRARRRGRVATPDAAPRLPRSARSGGAVRARRTCTRRRRATAPRCPARRCRRTGRARRGRRAPAVGEPAAPRRAWSAAPARRRRRTSGQRREHVEHRLAHLVRGRPRAAAGAAPSGGRPRHAPPTTLTRSALATASVSPRAEHDARGGGRLVADREGALEQPRGRGARARRVAREDARQRLARPRPPRPACAAARRRPPGRPRRRRGCGRPRELRRAADGERVDARSPSRRAAP